MTTNITERLFSSLSQLEAAITETKAVLSGMKNQRPEIIERLKCYEEVLRKQRILAETLDRSVKSENWDQVARHVDLIRGSSILIQLDSQSLISEMSQDSKEILLQQEFND